MTYLTNLDPFPVNSLSKGDVVYYADAHAIETDTIHLLQVTTVAAITSTSVLFDNGRKFLLSGEEVTRGNKGAIYAYTSLTRVMVSEAQNKDVSVLCADQRTTDIMERLQQALTHAGFQVKTTGIADESTLSAVTAYQKSRGMAFGDITLEVLQELGVEK